ncbi:uncharacterized protein LOC109834661 [Asparagus officinalis]|uniref:uncharacterized protein LOC109834661 n=1 Tax=Asparagus officinalis TaxID=4686 RepID=UPI00098E38F8|nr:uncharacterized protein LOC109834661 [Asparagus officinalis]
MVVTKFYCLGLVLLCFVLCLNGAKGIKREEPTQDEALHEKGPGVKVLFPERNYIANGTSIYISNGTSVNGLGDRVQYFASYFSNEGKWGTQAALIVYGLPNVQTNQLSSVFVSLVTAMNDSSNILNSISAGWYFRIYTVITILIFFTYWTADGFKNTGCYNVLCKGFVPSSPSQAPGFKIWPLSKYKGDQYIIKVKIHKDNISGNWLLHVQDSLLGYWPETLFTSLFESAQQIAWNGNVNFAKNLKGPPLGSGHFPEEGGGKAAAIQDIQFVNQHGQPYDLTPDRVSSHVDKKDCYRVGEFYRAEIGFMFYLGGPGGC